MNVNINKSKGRPRAIMLPKIGIPNFSIPSFRKDFSSVQSPVSQRVFWRQLIAFFVETDEDVRLIDHRVVDGLPSYVR